jgi:hypothetical protein
MRLSLKRLQRCKPAVEKHREVRQAHNSEVGPSSIPVLNDDDA